MENSEQLPQESKHSHSFEILVTWSAALSMALAAGVLASVKEINPTVRFQFSAASAIAFFGAGILTVAFFRALLHRSSNRWLYVLITTGIIAALFAMASALKNVSRDFIIGLVFAIAALSVGGLFLWRVGRFLSADEKRNQRES
jgi:uncharacterized membrane protein HdeD (DUF308 family)